MVPDPANQFPAPYVGMGNQWVSAVDPDGRWVSIAVAAVSNIIANREQIKKATEGENGNAWRGIGMALGYGAVGALGAYTGKAFTKAFDLSSTFSKLVGFGAGGILNVGFEASTGQFEGDHINKPGRILGSFLTGGFSVLAGKNIEESRKKGSDFGYKKRKLYTEDIALPDVKLRSLFSDEGLAEFGMLAKRQQANRAIFGWNQLGKYALSGLENVASKLNYYDGHLEIGQSGVFFGAGFSFGLTSYSLNKLGSSEMIKMFPTGTGYGFTSFASPLLSYGIADASSNLINHYGSKKNWNATFKNIYSNMSKSFFKIGSYAGSGIWGFSLTNRAFR